MKKVVLASVLVLVMVYGCFGQPTVSLLAKNQELQVKSLEASIASLNPAYTGVSPLMLSQVFHLSLDAEPKIISIEVARLGLPQRLSTADFERLSREALALGLGAAAVEFHKLAWLASCTTGEGATFALTAFENAIEAFKANVAQRGVLRRSVLPGWMGGTKSYTAWRVPPAEKGPSAKELAAYRAAQAKK